MEKEVDKVGQQSTSSSSPSSEKLTPLVDPVDESSDDNSSVPASLIGAENYITLTEVN